MFIGEDLFLNFVSNETVYPEYRAARYESCDILELEQTVSENHLKYFYSGSASEGVCNATDVDLMLIDKNAFVAYMSESIIPDNSERNALILEVENCNPGFARLKIDEKPGDKYEHLFENFGGKFYLNFTKYKDFITPNFLGINAITPHGPAMMDTNRMIEYVFCLRLVGWEDLVKDFFSRLENTQDRFPFLVTLLKNLDCFVVGISHPLSNNKNIENRLSFSLIERFLIRNWSDKQLSCYVFCKEINNTFLSEKSLEKGLCSYFIKTAIFWINETHDERFWEWSMVECIQGVLRFLKECVSKKCLPNYFIPENNMIMAFTDAQCAAISDLLTKITDSIFMHVLECQLFQIHCTNDFQPLLLSIYKNIMDLKEDDILQNILVSIFENSADNMISIPKNYAILVDQRTFSLFSIYPILMNRRISVEPINEYFPEDSVVFKTCLIYSYRQLAFTRLHDIFFLFEIEKKDLQMTEESFNKYLSGEFKTLYSSLVKSDTESDDNPGTDEMSDGGSSNGKRQRCHDASTSFNTGANKISNATSINSVNKSDPGDTGIEKMTKESIGDLTEIEAKFSDTNDTDQNYINFTIDVAKKVELESRNDYLSDIVSDSILATNSETVSTENCDDGNNLHDHAQQDVKEEIQCVNNIKEKNASLEAADRTNNLFKGNEGVNNEENFEKDSKKESTSTSWKDRVNISKIRKDKILEEAINYLEKSMFFPASLSDLGYTGYLNKALFYYLSYNDEQALTMLGNTLKSYYSIPADETRNERTCLPVILSGAINKSFPICLKRDDILHDLFMKRHLHILTIDPLILTLYLFYKLTENKNFLFELVDVEKVFHMRLDENQTTTYTSLLESYYYIRYKLGILHPDHPGYVQVTSPAVCTYSSNQNQCEFEDHKYVDRKNLTESILELIE